MRALMVLLFSSPKRNMKKKKFSFSFLHIPACPPQLFTGYLYLKHQVRGGLIIIIFFFNPSPLLQEKYYRTNPTLCASGCSAVQVTLQHHLWETPRPETCSNFPTEFNITNHLH